ncbi:hypothetical protein CsSME_00004088 [Camellia sinensis var. sinensis]
MDASRSQIQSFGHTEINWDKLEKTKFFVVGAGIFTGVTVALYPVSLIKTRLQVASKDAGERGAFSIIRGILRTDGIPGLYRGFGTVVTGAIPTRIIFLTALETTKAATFRLVEPFKLSKPTQAAIANGVAGMAAAVCSQAVFVSQKLMVQGYSGHATYNGGLDVPRKVLKVDGIRGLYRGFGLSVMTYSPSSAVWWASYGSSLFLGHGTTEHEESAPSLWTIVSVQAAGGIFAGATASCITTPLDTIKTRLQVMGHEKKLTVREVVEGLVADDGWKGLYRGLGPRFFTMSAWGTSMILSYEYLSRDSSFTLLLYRIIFVVVIIMQNDEIAKTFVDLIIVNYWIGKFKPMSYPLFSAYNHAQSI